MGKYQRLVEKFRGLPVAIITLSVLSRFVFGLGLGATVASSRRTKWRVIGPIIMGVGAALNIPAAVRVLRRAEAK